MKGTGYFIVDDRASGGGLYEADTRLCKHCQAVLVLEAQAVKGAYCTRCGGYVCADGPCAAVCTPADKQVDEALRLAARAAAGLSRTRRAAIAQQTAAIQSQLRRQDLHAAMGLER